MGLGTRQQRLQCWAITGQSQCSECGTQGEASLIDSPFTD